MAAIFSRRANLAAKSGIIGVVLSTAVGIGVWWLYPRTDYARHVGWTVTQPVPFSHEHHVGGLGIDCRMCHASVEVSSSAGLPPTYTCMTCHSQIWTKANLLKPLRHSLERDLPIEWNRVTGLPDYVYFNHSVHIAKGVGCESCHGEVAKMPLMLKAKSMTMEFCLSCHRDPGPNLRPKAQIYNTLWKANGGEASAPDLLRQYHVPDRNLTECSLCHR